MSHSSHDNHENLGHEGLGHILPISVYRGVLASLLVLTVITVGVSEKVGFFHFGNAALVVAMVVASIKALLVTLYFMHLKYENPLTWLYAAFPIILLGFLIGGVFLDNPFRVDGETGQIHAPARGVVVESGEHGAAAHH